MTPRNDPQHVIIVEREIAPHVTGTVLKNVIYTPLQRCVARETEATMPPEKTVIPHWVTRQHHLGDPGILDIQQPAADTMKAITMPLSDG